MIKQQKKMKTIILMTMKSRNSSIEPIYRDVIKAAKEGDAQLLQSLLRHNIQAKILVNALCYSATNSHLPCCALLLDKGADVNGVGLYGSTPLSTAAARLDVEIAALLLQRGADVNTKDENGRTPLLAAILNSANVSIVRLFLDAGADANMADRRGLTPLWATMLENGNPDILRLLLHYGADATMPYFGKTLLDIARKNGLKELEQILEEYIRG
jgi:ankyrin repeat protein